MAVPKRKLSKSKKNQRQYKWKQKVVKQSIKAISRANSQNKN